MTIFDLIGDIAFTKKPIDPDAVEETSPPYMIQRWLTMVNPYLAVVLNQSTNQHHSCFEDMEMWLGAFDTYVPKMKRSKISYIKKPVAKDDLDTLADCDNPDYINTLADLIKVSRREAHLMLQMSPEVLEWIKQDIEAFKKAS